MSIASDGTEGDLDSYGGSISDDGRYVAFVSEDTVNLDPTDSGVFTDVFLRDRQLNTTTRLTVLANGDVAVFAVNAVHAGVAQDRVGARQHLAHEQVDVAEAAPRGVGVVEVRDRGALQHAVVGAEVVEHLEDLTDVLVVVDHRVVIRALERARLAEAAWLVVVAIPLLVSLYLAIKRHYQTVSKRLRLAADKRLSLPPAPEQGGVPVVVLVGQLHRGSFEAVRYARTIAKELVAVHVDLGLGKAEAFREQWQRQLPDIPLVILDSPYRSLIDPVLEYIDEVEAERDDDVITVIIPEFVTKGVWSKLLHSQTGLALKWALALPLEPSLASPPCLPSLPAFLSMAWPSLPVC